MTGVAWWSQTAASNATQDSAVNWAEGMAPSAVNDSGRAMMASTAKWRDDITGAIATSGTSTAYTVSSYQQFDSLSRLNGQVIAFTPHTTCGSTVTLNVDGLGAKPLRSAPSTELVPGHLIQGTPYVAVYNSSDSAFYLQGFYGNPYSIPIGGLLPFTGTTAPNSSFVLPYGQAISRTTYSTYYGLVGTAYGTGDGSTTFNVPDLRGRIPAGADGMGGSLAGRLNTTSGMNGAGIGAVGGAQTATIAQNQLPNVAPSATTTIGASTTTINKQSIGGSAGGTIFYVEGGPGSSSLPVVFGTITTTVASINGGVAQQALATIQPTIITNYLLRVI